MTTELAKSLGFERIAFRSARAGEGVTPFDPRDVDESGEFVASTFLDILGVTYKLDQDTPEYTELGLLTAFHFLGSYSESAGIDLIDEADQISTDAYRAARFLYDKDGILGVNQLDYTESFGCNALYLNTLYVKPEYRGKGLGRTAIFRAIELHDPGSLAVVGLCPNSQGLVKDAPTDPFYGVKDGDQKLRKYYGKMGFVPFKKTPYLYMDMEQFPFQWRHAQARKKSKVRPKKVSVALV